MTASRGKIISIEDSDTDFMALRFALQSSGVDAELERFATGRVAISEFGASCPLPRKATLILLDLNLTGVDGRQVLKAVRTQDPNREVPVIVLSTSSHPRDIEFCQQAGADAYVVKPFELDEWQRKIGPLAGYWLQKASRMAERTATADEAAPAPGQTALPNRYQLMRAIESEIIPRLLLAHGISATCQTKQAALSDEISELARLALAQDTPAAIALIERVRSPGVTLDVLFKSHVAPAARLVGDFWKAELCTFGEFERAFRCLQDLLAQVNPSKNSDEVLH
jgi:CheY-like chemotaxis protein